MADSLITNLTAAASAIGTQELPVNDAGADKKITNAQLNTYMRGVAPKIPSASGTSGYLAKSDGTDLVFYPTGLFNASTAQVAAAYAADTYLAGSVINVAAGDWKAKGLYTCVFDMTKTAAGVATPIIIVRMGTAGTTADAAIATITYGAGTAVADNGLFTLYCLFRSVGAGTAAVLFVDSELTHKGNAVGLTNSAGNSYAQIQATSAGFDSTSQTKIGVSFNGGTAFSGTNNIVLASLWQP